MNTDKRKRRRRLLVAAAIILLIAVTVTVAVFSVIRGNGGAAIYQSPTDAPSAPVAIVFGAGYSGHVLSPVLADRVRAGVDLYHAGKVRKLLMTGDNGRAGYSEPDAMKAAAVRMGVPAADILCDYAGFHTYDSLYRAREIFGVRRALLVTQTYHLHRALYTATHLGLDVAGVAAERRPYPVSAPTMHANSPPASAPGSTSTSPTRSRDSSVKKKPTSADRIALCRQRH